MFQWAQHGKPTGLHVPQQFETFHLQKKLKLTKFHDFLKIVCKE